MTMIDKPFEPRETPDWFLEAMRIMRDVGQGLQDLDPRLRDEMQFVRDSLGTVKVSLSVLDMTANRVLSDLAKSESPQGG
jgi:hypothetical protein